MHRAQSFFELFKRSPAILLALGLLFVVLLFVRLRFLVDMCSVCFFGDRNTLLYVHGGISRGIDNFHYASSTSRRSLFLLVELFSPLRSPLFVISYDYAFIYNGSYINI